MSRQLTDKRGQEIERVADQIHDLTNDIIDALYERYRDRNFHRDADRLDALTQEFRAVVEAHIK